VPDDDHKERLDRELIELLNELRVVLPGVQVMFAFLLILPFSQGFPKVDEYQRDIFLAAVLSTTLATALLIAPTSYHRLRFRDGDKERLLRTSNRLAIAGMALLAMAMTCVVFLVSDAVFSLAVALPATVFSALVFGWFWYGLPLSRAAAEREGVHDTS